MSKCIETADFNDQHPKTDLVILAAGQASRMNGVNKLLQCFDDQIQLLKIYQSLKDQVQQIWINSHRDVDLYQKLIAQVQCYQDDQAGFLGPMMGMKSAWSYVESDYVLFVPCDITYIPSQLVSILHQYLAQNPQAMMAYVCINTTALYPFCLMKRSSQVILAQGLAQNQLSLKSVLQPLHAQSVYFEQEGLLFHSINSMHELEQYQRT